MSKIIVLCGLPGSGKTTLAKTEFKDAAWINQDTLGNKHQCVIAAQKAIETGKDVIIDRVNFNVHQRRTWVTLGKFYGITNIQCVYIKADPDVCVKRIQQRKDHPTITEDLSLEKKHYIVYNFYKQFEEPSEAEGFSHIVVIPDFIST